MPRIAFLDTEVDPGSGKILDIGCMHPDGGVLHTRSLKELVDFLGDSEYICGHNIIEHDLKYLNRNLGTDLAEKFKFIDTLFLSPLLFPQKPYHKLVKDDKLQTDDLNNPLNDSSKARDLFNDEVDAFNQLDNELKIIYYNLLKDRVQFESFFKFLDYAEESNIKYIPGYVSHYFENKICESVKIPELIATDPVSLAYALALINCNDRYSITPPWVLHTYNNVQNFIHILRSNPCLTGCRYCDQWLDPIRGLKNFFGFDQFREFNGQPLQKDAVNAALNNKSILVIFPTGGGKSLTFQLPALMAGESSHALTVIISPLQSLMKDQVDNLERKGITNAVTINGLLDPIERAKAIERVTDGTANILYISPESLRSRIIEHLLTGRDIARFVIDEAHCFSSWGQDFRVDYLYIGEYIKNLQQKKNLSESIPVSCFTATARLKVIEDIQVYFKDTLNQELEVFKTGESRKNLHYTVIKCDNNNSKYENLRNLIDSKRCPTIVYASRTKRTEELAERLSNDGYAARAFHGKMEIREKTTNQESFMNGDVDIMVATSAFGMGVDKDNVGMVIHYEISDSLENYVQESGRAGRDKDIQADCFILYNEDDLGKHFNLLNQTKIDIKQIQEIWRAVKDLTKYKKSISNSALEIARKAGWNEQIDEIETIVKAAISALEQSGYVKRGLNSPRVFATSILSKNAEEAIEKINRSERFEEKEKEHAIRIIKKLISSKSRANATDEEAESRVDYISDHLGIPARDVIRAITLLKAEKILADDKDLTAFIKSEDKKNRSDAILEKHARTEKYLFDVISEKKQVFNIKELNESAQETGIKTDPRIVKTIFNFWSIKDWIKKEHEQGSDNYYRIRFIKSKEKLAQHLERRNLLAGFIIKYLFEKTGNRLPVTESSDASKLVEFSILELKEAYERSATLFKAKIGEEDVEDALFLLSRIDALNIEGGFLVIYNKLNIERIEENTRRQYKVEDYASLKMYYENRVQQIHIVGEYAGKMISDYKGALTFVDDYFQLNYNSFLHKYFPGSRTNEIRKSITPAKFKKLFGELSTRQLDIINDRDSKRILVAAGPGSGKTKLLVHKLASLLLMEDVKQEHLLMLTFSRAAVSEFKKRLVELIGHSAYYVEIKTFHSFSFDLLGRVGSLEKSTGIIREAVDMIQKNEVEPGRIVKTVLVIDEAQDMDSDEFALVEALMNYNEEMRVIAVGDDDQNIYAFRGSDSQYFQKILNHKSSRKYELVENFRSKRNLVDFSNQFLECFDNRLKKSNILPYAKTDGQISIVKYNSGNLIIPLCQEIRATGLSGSTAILTRTNDEALEIAGLLNKNQLNVRLIQSNSGFNLLKLREIRIIMEHIDSHHDSQIIPDELLNELKREVIGDFYSKEIKELCLNMLKEFELTHPKTKYRSDLEVFIGESNIEDFTCPGNDVILVSTIHKAKGRELDNVYIHLNNYDLSNDESRRQLYVGLTRARQNLTVHYNSSFLDHIETGNLIRYTDLTDYSPPDQIALQLSHSDLNLGYFHYVQHRIPGLKTGYKLLPNGEGCTNTYKDQVLRYSNSFNERMRGLKAQGYKPTSAKITFMVYWFNKELNEEKLIILPELTLEKSTDSSSLPR
ncbi:MAG: RecQ family ATP-dependent DNA helicase [Bacteroidales bacterium]|nr:RecQ family ATP-dependent DNA helicase [Bacteroidales bacterium]MBN2863710.1 RecQ family ATP-dependent DNA helicase [Bacteroidales bacterium]